MPETSRPQAASSPDDATGRKVYRISPLRLAAPIGLPGAFALALLAGSLLVGDASERPALAFTGLILLIITLGMFPLVWYPKLLVSSGGMEIRQIGWGIRTSWDNIESADLRRGGEGFFLRHPLTGRGAWALQLGRLLPAWYTGTQAELVAQGRWFPIAPFGWWLRHGDLAEQLKRHAPSLFSTRPQQ